MKKTFNPMVPLKVPKYVADILSRSRKMPEWMINGKNDSEPFYTLIVHKSTAWTYASTFRYEMERFVDWCNRTAPAEYGPSTARVVRVPDRTRYCDQVAMVEILDPLMLKLEKYGLINY